MKNSPTDGPIPKQADSAESLLREWFEWWSHANDVPAKLPDSLHVRTAIHLTGKGSE